ncbi:SIR2-like domain-containing protein [Pedococcus dokdonensis]|uniref:SIR2-like domain-containing protein n=1 Tax=Pedococcus dokdonensis TaxID=443156 RepID=A0A1H0QP33_9MICO|nr:SIR2 family protein [Pedococcus dokdonensis]SDP18845.1 SIR2-like domain-containing protein [Pedococcus dokdonensis]
MARYPVADRESPEPINERAFYTQLRADHANIVPVVGAGLTVEAGAPSFMALIDHLIERAEADGSVVPRDCATNEFAVIDLISATLGEEWVSSETARLYEESELRTTPALLALSKVRSGLIITTNYDLAIENAARAARRPVQSLTLDEFDTALAPRDGTLRVLHLHGICTDPSTIVLTDASYAAMLGNERSQLLLRALASTHTFVFLGHSLAEREEHIRRDLRWSIDAARAPRKRPHLLLTTAVDLGDVNAVAFKEDLESKAHLRVVQIEDPQREYQAAVRAASAISGPAVSETVDEALVITDDEIDPHYLPLPMAEAEQVSSSGGRGAYMAKVWQYGSIRTDDLDATTSNIVIEAEGGAGKSQELVQIVRRSPVPALLQVLSTFNVRTAWTDAGKRFVSGMNSARAARSGVPKLTEARLRDGAYVFALDGLDEVPSPSRPDLIRLLSEVAAAYPQHRFVLGSRPLPELTEQETFARWTPMTDMTWVNEYATARGVSPDQLQAALPDTGDIGELIQVPIYAAAAVGRVFTGVPLPKTALELICSMADERLGSDTRIEASADDVRVWLDRLALAMQLAGVTSVTVAGLVASDLHRDLDGIEPDEQTIGELVSRALLRDAEGVVRFPANVMKEARAARALLDAGEAGLALLRKRVLVELDEPDTDGNPVRAVQSTWVNVIELLLPAATDPSWVETVAKYDSTLAARGTRTDATSEQRAAAVDLIWGTYLARRVWFERRATIGNGTGDSYALARLLHAGVPPGFGDKIRAALIDDERTTRGNAVDVALLVLPLDELLPALARAVRDPDPVVRRRAAAAGWSLETLFNNLDEHADLFNAYIEDMADQALHHDRDDMATETLIGVAVDLAPEGRSIEIAQSASGKARQHAMMCLTRRFDRSKLLEILRDSEPFDTILYDELTEDRGAGPRDPWPRDDVVALAHIVALRDDQESRWADDAADILAQDPVASILTLLTHSVSEERDLGVGWRLIGALNEEQVSAVLEQLRKPDTPSLAALGLPPEGPGLDLSSATFMVPILERTLERWRNPAPWPVARHTGRRVERQVHLLRGSAAALPAPDLADVFADDRVATAFDPVTQSASMSVTRGLLVSAEQDRALDPGECAQLFTFLLDWTDRDLEPWLAKNWSPAAHDLVAPSLSDMTSARLRRLVDVLPGPWTPQLGDRVLGALDVDQVRLGEQMAAALAVAERVGVQHVRDWGGAHPGAAWVDPVLVRLGDCDAERRLLAVVAEDPSTITRHPRAYDEEWVSFIRCNESTEPLAALVRAALIAGVENNDLEPICRAFDRTAGHGAPQVWERLARDAEIPSASFLYYERRIALTSLVDQAAGTPSFPDSDLTALVVRTVPRSPSKQ